eukprot:CAMPEP_0178608400 /NCGR_PEP_ID=MMETSP0697-20121206/38114_1 /TAXON_ID=265572 /ORGANISM="Extubocellulus spinifer, Strain CCMP396" /LENGTH=167 /DNA_ID=CAMNT_0020246949 /DNA_START=106 /DNA_END=606 /DNA_ORIENTATION=+
MYPTCANFGATFYSSRNFGYPPASVFELEYLNKNLHVNPEPTAAATAVIISTAVLLLLIGTISPSASVHLGVEAFTLSQRPLSPIVVSTRRRPYRRYGSDPPPSSQLAVPPLDVSRVPTGESFADAAAAEDTGSGSSSSSNNSGASTGADGAVDEDKLPSFLFHGDG